LPLDTEVVQLAEMFGVLPDTLAEQMSEYWYRLSVVFFRERSQSQRKGGGAPAPQPDADELDDTGRWFLTG